MISKAISPYVAGAVVAAVLAVSGALIWQRHTINGLRDDLTLSRAAVQGYASAQTTNLDSIAKLQAALDKIVAERRIDKAALTIAVRESIAAEQAVTDRLNATEKELAHVYADNPRARAWGDVGVDADVAAKLPKHRTNRPN